MMNNVVSNISLAQSICVINPYNGEVISRVDETSASQIGFLVSQAKEGARLSKAMPRNERAKVLLKSARIVEERMDEFVSTICQEAGKTIKQARKEVLRCVNTLTLSGEEAKRHIGEVIPFDSYEGSENRRGWFDKEPLGIIAAITPYNDPLNLVAHKLGPAIASGNSVILKPSELTPLSAIALVDALEEAGLPKGVVNIAIGGVELGRALVKNRDVRMVSFTGGFRTGEEIAAISGLKKISMDLGGNAPVIILDDADINKAVEACVSGAFWAAGQNCIGTQRILVHSSIADEFQNKFVTQTMNLVVGNPLLEESDMGPMINGASAKRAEDMVNEAIASGATLLCGGKREGSLFSPTVLCDVDPNCGVYVEEVFSPIVVINRFEDIDEAIEIANSTEYALHAGVFTNSLEKAYHLADSIEAAGIMINDSSDYRFDAMPFGGFKYGSLGREGVRFAMDEMSQSKTVCVNR